MLPIHEFPPLPLCEACQLLFAPPADSEEGRRLFAEDAGHAIFGGNSFYFRKLRKDVKEGCKKGCELCRRVVLIEKRCDPDYDPREKEQNPVDFTEEDWESWLRPSWGPPRGDAVETYFRYNKETGRLKIESSLQKEGKRGYADLHVQTAEGKSAY
jgi:hypothetical protein